MADKNLPMSFVMACRDFFGMKDGQTIGQFAMEIKALNTADRAYFTRGLEANGYVISDKLAA